MSKTSLLTGLVLALLAPRLVAAGPSAEAPWNRASRLVFFAVLEGLYEDGVPAPVVASIIGKPGSPDHERYKAHFVYACPLCHPTFEAFKLYQKREAIFGLKGGADTLGPGLAPDVVAALGSPERATRLAALNALIERWVARRLELMRLDASELEEITREMEKNRETGMAMLKREPETGRDARTSCAICDGSVGACRLAPPRR